MDGLSGAQAEPFLDRYGIERIPATTDATLRGWDAADAYLVTWLAGGDDGGPDFPAPPGLDPDRELLVVGDRFGALACGLVGEPVASGGTVRVVSDSPLALDALGANLLRNGLDRSRVLPTPDSSWPERVERAQGAAPPALVLLKVPRTLAYLEDLLVRIRTWATEGVVVVGAGMTRHVHTSTLDAFERIVGPTVTSHARSKARLIHARAEPRELPRRPVEEWTEFGVATWNRPNVFSSGGLDAGTRLLLESFERGFGSSDESAPARIADVGCGNGILGVWLARRFPEASIHLTDASFQAVESARETVARNLDAGRDVEFLATDALTGIPDGTVDFAVSNPPFHAQGAKGDDTAFRIFTDARRALRSGGRLRVVGNRHLGYHATLARVFGNSEVIASDPKFVVVESRRG